MITLQKARAFVASAQAKTTALLVIATAAATSAPVAFAQTAPADALAAVTSLSDSAAGFGPVMFGLAVTVVGIMIGVKWIKRAKGAA